MRAPDWWWRDRPTNLARFLEPLGSIIGVITARRLAERGGRADIPVICVGNPVAGGAGKTPTAIAVAGILKRNGRRPVFLSRGYGGRLAGPVQVDPARHGSVDVGDEPLLLARYAPAIVSGDRLEGAALAASLGDVIVMDDGFQNPSLSKDLSLLVVDGGSGVGNGLCVPAGPLRAPLDEQLARAQGLVLIGKGAAGERVASAAAGRGLAIHRGSLEPDRRAAAGLRGLDVLAFAGIGRPDKFADTLRSVGADVVQLTAFGDHHRFTAHEARALLMAAERAQLTLVTTEKDMVRLSGAADASVRELARRSRVLPVALVFEDGDALAVQISDVLRP
ncbi:tetraacyldisaccharide 4'-kinase [Flaviflagellibacter deserti]|uniref:Tetraacyldisaccharide 4'-kinase n=1 Tax=Flaviflagellibacter deserti TaxID=2267266 RepID=A0ABV9YV21_9HYPH